MESKRLREEVGSLEGERCKVVEELEVIKQRPQFDLLNTVLSEKQMTELRDISMLGHFHYLFNETLLSYLFISDEY